MAHYFLYSGYINYPGCFRFIELAEETQEKHKSSDVVLVLSTFGGASSAAYKIGRYLQSSYNNIEIFVPGFCSSAGTLLAIAANKIIFSPYGELGPLDVQRTKQDRVGSESGLDMSEALTIIQLRATTTFQHLADEIIEDRGNSISFQVALNTAAGFVSSLFAPVFGHIDLTELGERERAMRIATEYGVRLNKKSQNLEEENAALHFLARGCPSHGFVIDMLEAKKLFKNVQPTSEEEKKIILKYRYPEKKVTIKDIAREFQKVKSKKVKNNSQNSKKSKTALAATNETNEDSHDEA